MHIVIEIPNKDIPKYQEVIDIRLHFIDGHIVGADGWDEKEKTILRRNSYGFAELPKGHGRLIDGDRFDVISYQHTSDDFDNGVMWLAEQIDNAPTIIEADTESEDKE